MQTSIDAWEDLHDSGNPSPFSPEKNFQPAEETEMIVSGPRQDRLADVRHRAFTAVHLIVGAWMATVLGGAVAWSEDWPAYRHDMARSGITSERLAPPLAELWVFEGRHAPEPAWGDPKSVPVEDILELRRVHFDDVFQPVVADGAVFFGSSADNKVYCLDAATGAIRWTKITGGPVRLAPMVAGGRVFVGSDDGYAYCLDADDGSLVWKFHAAPEDRRLLGHGKMISLWPLRTGVLVDEGIAYFSAGIFPGEGVFLYAVDAATGREIWRNDTCGETPQSTISPQGYLLASRSSLYVPLGRVSPATFDRRTGRLRAQPPFFGKTVGGTYALLAGDDLYTGTEEVVGYHSQNRDRFATFAGRRMVVTDKVAYLAANTELAAMDRTGDRAVRWKAPCYCADALILAADVLFAGGDGQVVAVNAVTGKQVWQAKVDRKVKGLAVADGRLLATTESGKIYCFGPEDAPRHGMVADPIEEDPYAGSPLSPVFRQAAERILQETGVRRGYCLVLGVETGELALELARRSDLTVYAVDPDAQKVGAARRALDAAGMHGGRVCVEQWPLDKVPYSDFFANLIVSETAMVTGEIPGDPAETARMLKPIGGTIMFGQPSRRTEGAKPLQADAFREGFARTELDGAQVITAGGTWAKATRGALPGAGDWTHQYANPANTASGDDVRVKAPLQVLWFGHPGPGDMVNRHRRAAAPLAIDGRMFIQGENTVMAYDAYNGVKLWQHDISGAIRTDAPHDSSNLALSHDGLLLAVEDRCLRLDPATGATRAIYRTPPAPGGKPRSWGYVACVGKTLFGSRTANARQSDCVFAVDVETGKQRWVYQGKQIPHNAIAIGDGKVFLVSSDVTPEQRQAVLERQRARIPGLPEPQRAQAEGELAKADVRLVVALDATTGEPVWQQPVDLTHCGGWHAALKQDSAILAMMYHDGVLVFFGVYLDGHYWNQFFAGEFDSRRVTALAGEDGEFLWSRQVGFRVRPMILGDTLYAEPWAFNLHTGEPIKRVHPVTGEEDLWQFSRPGHHCGLPVASPNCLFFRSYTLGYYDLQGDYGTMHFGAQRPGCWINFLPAAGLLLMPEASTGCMCAFPNMCSIVFEPAERNKAWAVYSARGAMTPVKRLAINFGAPGDRRDAAGNLWLGYPRPFQGRLVMKLDVLASFHAGGKFTTDNSVYVAVTETDDPWVFASAASGLKQCTIPLLSPDDGATLYRVRLAFADPDHDHPGRRVFDIKLQNETVAEDFDVVEAAGGRHRAVVRQFDGVAVSDNLVIELVPKIAHPQANQLPILQGVEIIEQEVLALGCATPEFTLGNLAPQQSGQLRLANRLNQPIEGTLQIDVPEGFQVSPAAPKVALAVGEERSIPIEASVGQGVPAGIYRAMVRLVAGDGTVILKRPLPIEHLGRRSRVVLRPVADAYVHQRYPNRNRGTVPTLLIDGGDQKMGDADHALAYLRFHLDVPGKPVGLRLRITNAGNPTSDSGRVCLVTEPWNEKTVVYAKHPKPGQELARLGPATENQMIECSLPIELEGRGELNLVIDPLNCDGVDFVAREGANPPELVVEYEP
ncbi:MAG: PQQ-binding-like beta-propeller repeat protein [Pirellulales bacterium]|nr:PQQ-binding-like beta-propeller repeat protein [Pirellulales bacterium]